MKIAVVGATGLIGSKITEVLTERKFPVTEFIPVTNDTSPEEHICFDNKICRVRTLEECIEEKPSIALFSAGTIVSLEWAPKFAKAGITVIDKSSIWRMHGKVPLVVPEVNAHAIKEGSRIIASPNCSVIQLAMVLAPLHYKYKINRIVISTYQSVTGTGLKSIQQLKNERNGITGDMAYPYPIDLNIIPHGGIFLHTGCTTEEIKLVDETRKVFDDESIQITATVVRIPVFGGNSESVNVEFEENFDMENIRLILSESPGILLQDDILNCVYPMPLYAQGKNEIFVGRLRRDDTRHNAVNMWIVTDCLRKGAATNIVQIAEYIVEKKYV